MRRLTALALIAAAGCASGAITPARTPSSEMQACGEAREIHGRIVAAPPHYGVTRRAALRMGVRYQACTEALEAERDLNADAADHNRPDSFWEDLQEGAIGAGVGSILILLLYVAAI